MELLPENTPANVRNVIMATVKNVPSERSGLNEIKDILKVSTEGNQIRNYKTTGTVSMPPSLRVTYSDLISHANNLEINFISWDRCNRGTLMEAGAFMNVFAGTYEDNGKIQNAAFKSVRSLLTGETKESKRSFILRDVSQEIRIMGCLKGHSNIVQILGVSFDDHKPVLIVEISKSNLEEYLQGGEHRVEWKIKLRFMYDIALGLEAIHKAEVVHGDLKCSNILVYKFDNEQIVAKISGFAYSSTDLSVQEGRTPGFSYNFRSRECFDLELRDWNGKHVTDIYSYGLVVYQIAKNGNIPFDDYDNLEIDIMKKEGTELAVLMDYLPDDTPIEVREIIMATVKNVPSERIGLDEVKNTLKECTEWDQVYSYKDTKTVFSSLTPIKPQESIKISKMNELSIPPSLKKTIFWEYQRLADDGNIVSLSRLGSCWNFGFGTEKDSLRAFECYTKAAEAGDATAQFNLGFCYENGTGTPQDYVKAAELYTKAAEAGDTDAQNYTKGNTKAIELYTKAAETGDANAQNKLGLCYYNGEGVPQDYIKAVELYIKAAEAGNTMALNNLGLCYENGFGVTKDYIKAVELYTKAAEAGNGDDYIKAIESYLKSVKAKPQED